MSKEITLSSYQLVEYGSRCYELGMRDIIKKLQKDHEINIKTNFNREQFEARIMAELSKGFD
jgi:hypothetical protein